MDYYDGLTEHQKEVMAEIRRVIPAEELEDNSNFIILFNDIAYEVALQAMVAGLLTETGGDFMHQMVVAAISGARRYREALSCIDPEMVIKVDNYIRKG